jgi:hypothetical protein
LRKEPKVEEELKVDVDVEVPISVGGVVLGSKIGVVNVEVLGLLMLVLCATN